MKRLNLQRILSIITISSMLAMMIMRIGPCGMAMCLSQNDSAEKTGCCGKSFNAHGTDKSQSTDPDIGPDQDAGPLHVSDFQHLPGSHANHSAPVNNTQTDATCHKAARASSALAGASHQSKTAASEHPSDSDGKTTSGCDNCICEIRNSADAEVRAASAVTAQDISGEEPAFSGEIAAHIPVQHAPANLTRRAPPSPGVPAYILFASFLN